MKKLLLAILVLLVIGVTFTIIRNNSGYETLEEALNPSGSNAPNIIYKEKTGEGYIVFYSRFNNKDFSKAYVKKSFGRYKVVYSGVAGDIDTTLEKIEMTNYYFPVFQNKWKPVYSGLIGDDDITQVNVIEKKRNINKQAKIINIKDYKYRLWLLYMDELEGSKFEIIGLSKDNEEIVKIDGNIYPLNVEDKPLKGY